MFNVKSHYPGLTPSRLELLTRMTASAVTPRRSSSPPPSRGSVGCPTELGAPAPHDAVTDIADSSAAGGFPDAEAEQAQTPLVHRLRMSVGCVCPLLSAHAGPATEAIANHSYKAPGLGRDSPPFLELRLFHATLAVGARSERFHCNHVP